jgi:hypothetical protein
MVKAGTAFKQVAGNDTIMLTSIAPSTWRYALPSGRVLFEKPVLTAPAEKRVAIEAPVASLHAILLALSEQKIAVEHIYDY